MSLRLKVNLIVGVLTILFIGAVLGLQFDNMRESVREEVIAANRVAAQLLNRTALRYAAQGAAPMLIFLQGVGRVRSNELTLYDAEGNVLYRSPPSPYKAGRDAPDWFDRLVSPPPAESQIRFPDGRLVVRSDASRAVVDAWDYFVVLVASALGLLVVVNLLVFWLVGRTVRPFGRIVGALNQLEAGNFEVALPRLPGTEAAAMGAAFNRMVKMLAEHIETEKRAVRAERALSDSRELTRWIDHHIEQERRMIARELHDELGQSVTAMRSVALSIAQRSTDPQTEQAARLIADESSRLYDAMHGLIPRLAPLVLDNFGLADALGDLVERTRRQQPGLRIDLDVDLDGAQLSSDAALTLYRASQEGITNAVRHGRASRLHLAVRSAHDGLTLSLTDDGQGLAPGWSEQKGHYGLRWLAERVESLRGNLGIEPVAPHGVRLHVQLPA